MTGDSPPQHRNLDDFSGISSDWFWETDAEHRFSYFSKRIEEVTKFEMSTMLGRRRDHLPAERIGDPDWIAHLDDLANHRPFRNFEYRFTRPSDGTVLWVRIAGEPVFDEDGTFRGYRGTGHDFTAEKVAMQRLEETIAELAAQNEALDRARTKIEDIAYTDALTDLLNRRAFERDLARALAERSGLLCMLHVDLDRFKWINDTLGHPAGDKVLEVAAARIRTVVDNRGLVYRVGGDEFTIVLPDLENEDLAIWMGDAIVESLSLPIRIDAQHVTVGASVGIASTRHGACDAASLASHADAALYEAKNKGRGVVGVSTPELQRRIDDERRLSLDIPGAIDRREFIPYFQPQVDVATGRVIGAEALARWHHPERGVLTPHAFLRAATELAKIDRIDGLVLEGALETVARLRARGLDLPSLSVNVSEARLVDPALCDDIERLWTDRTCQLTVELLETISFDETRAEGKINAQLERMRALGVRIETDDFGSGRASINGLLRVSPDGIKIDRSLVERVVSSPRQRSVVRSILDIAKALEIDCLAEGVETMEDIGAMVGLGCTRFQGYAISRPVSEEGLIAFLGAPATLEIATRVAGAQAVVPYRKSAV